MAEEKVTKNAAIRASLWLNLLCLAMSQSGLDKLFRYRVWHRAIGRVERVLSKHNDAAILPDEVSALPAHFYVQPAHVFLPDGQAPLQVINHKVIKFFTSQHVSRRTPIQVSAVILELSGPCAIAFLRR